MLDNFLSKITEVPEKYGLSKGYGDLTQMAIKHNIEPEKFKCFGYQLTIRNGLIAEEESILGKSKVFYASPEGINNRIFVANISRNSALAETVEKALFAFSWLTEITTFVPVFFAIGIMYFSGVNSKNEPYLNNIPRNFEV